MSKTAKQTKCWSARIAAVLVAVSCETVAAATIANMSDTYLESDGSQAIDTGWPASAKTKVVVDFECADTNGTSYVFGSAGSSLPFSAGLYFQSGANIAFAMGDAANNSVYKNFGSKAPPTFSRYTATLDCASGTATLAGAGKTIEVDVSSQIRTATNNLSLAVFARHTASGYDSGFTGRLYSMQVFDDGELVRDLIPYSFGGVTGLYDRANGVVYGNVQSEGNPFVFGTDSAYALGSSAKPVYIDTGFTPDCKTKVEFDFALCSTNSGPRPFGVIATSGLCWGMYVTTAGEIAYTVRSKNNNGATTKIAADGRRRVLTLDGPDNSAVLADADGEILFEGTLSQKPDTNERAAKSLVVFGGNAASGYSNAADVKVYGMKIWDDGTLVRDFTPRIVDGVSGLWDAQNSKFYTPETGCRLAVGGAVECASAGGIGAAASADAYLEAAEAGPILDTGYRFKKNSRIVLDYAFVATNDTSALFALDARSGASAPCLGFYNQNGGIRFRYFDGAKAAFDSANSPAQWNFTRHVYDIDLSTGKRTIKQNGTDVKSDTFTIPSSFDAGASIVLFGRRTDNGTGVQDPQALRVYSLKIYEDGNLVRDFTPAVLDGKAGLYDPLTGTFAGNVNASAKSDFSIHGGGSDGNGLMFSKHPQSCTVSVDGSSTLSAHAPGATGYQWLKDGEPIPGATGRMIDLEWEKAPAASYQCLAFYAIAGYGVSNTATVENTRRGMVIILR